MAERDNNFRKLIFNDKYLIITAILLAIVIWVVTSLNIGTDETRKVHISVPINLSDELQETLGMQYYTLDEKVDIEVTISGAKYVIGQVTEDDLKVKFDSSNVRRAGVQTIPIQVKNKSKTKDFTITNVYPETVDAYFDIEDSKDFPVSIVYDKDNVADGYVFGTPYINVDTVTVVGPKSYVDLIDRVDAEVNFGNTRNLKETYSTDCKLEIKGSSIEPNYMKIYSVSDKDNDIKNAEVTLPVLKLETLPVAVKFKNEPKHLDKEAVKTTYSFDELDVGILDNTDISSAVVGTVDFKNLKVGRNVYTFKTSDINGVIVLEGQEEKVKVTVTVSDDYEEITVPISTNKVTFKSVPSNKNAKVRSIDKRNVRIIAPKGTDIKEDDLKVVADVSKIKDASCPLDITVNNKSAWVISDYNANISLTDK